ncbi:type II toxin-antitoxin system HipA family toxin [Marinobacter sp.]|uniref:type II toxin-antitoxin system HipA family toxin n=1 Tax=Marinobacter sp. TaxID=50741 RepID=UPI003B51965B
MAETLTIQAYWNGNWTDAGKVVFRDPQKGLTGVLQFYYDTMYVNDADTFRPGLNFTDERAISVALPGDFVSHFTEKHAAPPLRDMIPQGAGRRSLCKLWEERDTGPGMDFRLFKEGCVAPIGNLRIKEAAETFQERISGKEPVAFTREDVADHIDDLIEYAHSLGIAIEGVAGAGGEAPKLLLVEDDAGTLYLEGTLDEARIAQHWLVKFPRGRMLSDDEDILRAEGVFYEVLAELGVDTIKGSEVHEGRNPSLWLPRFDRVVREGQIQRYGVESVYSLMGMVGDGARLQHTDVLSRLNAYLDTDFDDLLVEYLLRDVVNTAIGNTDNHGRNTAILKRDGIIHLAPAFDMAPMVLDHEVVARTTIWPKHFQQQRGVNYAAIIKCLAHDPEAATKALIYRVGTLADFKERAIRKDLPLLVKNSPLIHLDSFSSVANAIQGQWDEIRTAR